MTDRERRNNPFLRIFLYGLLCTGCVYLLRLGTTLLASRFHIYLPPSPVVNQFLVFICAIAPLWFMVRFVDKRPLTDFGFAPGSIMKELAIGFLAGAALFSTGMGIRYVAGWNRVIEKVPNAQVAELLVFTLLVGIVEEIAFRGYVLTNLEKRYGSGIALLVSCLLFGLVHLISPAQNTPIGKGVYT